MAKFNLYTRADQSRDFQSGSLSSGYIYYDILGQEGSPDMARLRSQVSNRLEKVKNQLNDHSIAVQVLREMARAEYEKEVLILEKQFGRKFAQESAESCFKDIKNFRELIEMINETFQMKQVFLRNKARILNEEDNTTKIVDVGSLTWSYIINEVMSKSAQDNLREFMNVQIEDYYVNGTISQAQFKNNVKKKVEQMFEKGVDKAVDKMLISKTFRKDEQTDNSYQQLINYFKQNPERRNKYIQKLYSIYGINDLKKELVNQIMGRAKQSTSMSTKGLKQSLNDKIGKSVYTRGGMAAEELYNQILLALVEEMNQKGIKAQFSGVGHYGTKPDHILTINVDKPDLFDSTISQLSKEQGLMGAQSLTRSQAQLGYERFTQQLQEFDDSCVVYVNTKYYNLDSNEFIKSGGFGGGKFINMSEFKSVFTKSYTFVNELTGAILQLAQGALGNKQLEESLRAGIAEMAAQFLFDDYLTIGRKHKNLTAIHIFNLDGVLIPLSLVLTALARAFEDSSRYNYKDIVRVHFSIPEILYPYGIAPGEEGKSEPAPASSGTPIDQRKWGMNAWNYQREYAQLNSLIGINFLKNFRDLIKEVLNS